MDSFNEINNNWEQLAKYLNQYDETLPESKEKEIAERIRDFYFPNGQVIDKSQLEPITKVKLKL